MLHIIIYIIYYYINIKFLWPPIFESIVERLLPPSYINIQGFECFIF